MLLITMLIVQWEVKVKRKCFEEIYEYMNYEERKGSVKFGYSK